MTLTTKDIQLIKGVVIVAVKEEIGPSVEAVVERKLKTDISEGVREEVHPVSIKIDKVLAMLSDLAGQLKGTQDEQTVQGHHLSETIDRVESLEKIHPQGQHIS